MDPAISEQTLRGMLEYIYQGYPGPLLPSCDGGELFLLAKIWGFTGLSDWLLTIAIDPEHKISPYCCTHVPELAELLHGKILQGAPVLETVIVPILRKNLLSFPADIHFTSQDMLQLCTQYLESTTFDKLTPWVRGARILHFVRLYLKKKTWKKWDAGREETFLSGMTLLLQKFLVSRNVSNCIIRREFSGNLPLAIFHLHPGCQPSPVTDNLHYYQTTLQRFGEELPTFMKYPHVGTPRKLHPLCTVVNESGTLRAVLYANRHQYPNNSDATKGQRKILVDIGGVQVFGVPVGEQQKLNIFFGAGWWTDVTVDIPYEPYETPVAIIFDTLDNIHILTSHGRRVVFRISTLNSSIHYTAESLFPSIPIDVHRPRMCRDYHYDLGLIRTTRPDRLAYVWRDQPSAPGVETPYHFPERLLITYFSIQNYDSDGYQPPITQILRDSHVWTSEFINMPLKMHPKSLTGMLDVNWDPGMKLHPNSLAACTSLDKTEIYILGVHFPDKTSWQLDAMWDDYRNGGTHPDTEYEYVIFTYQPDNPSAMTFYDINGERVIPAVARRTPPAVAPELYNPVWWQTSWQMVAGIDNCLLFHCGGDIHVIRLDPPGGRWKPYENAGILDAPYPTSTPCFHRYVFDPIAERFNMRHPKPKPLLSIHVTVGHPDRNTPTTLTTFSMRKHPFDSEFRDDDDTDSDQDYERDSDRHFGSWEDYERDISEYRTGRVNVDGDEDGASKHDSMMIPTIVSYG